MSNFNEYLQYRALRQKYRTGHNTIESLTDLVSSGTLQIKTDDGNLLTVTDIEQIPLSDFAIKNLCAKVPAHLVDLIDQVTGELDISKREFIEISLFDAVERALQIIEAADIHAFSASNHGG